MNEPADPFADPADPAADDDTADDDTADVSAEEMFESFEVEDEFGDLKLVNVSREWYAMSDVPRSTHPSHVRLA